MKKVPETVRPVVSGALISPLADFMLVGGLSLFLIALFFVPWFRDLSPYEVYFATFCLSFVINYPHFMHSYQLLYRGFGRKLRDPAAWPLTKFRLVLGGIAAPAVLFVLLIYGATQNERSFLPVIINAMFFFVGWHYAKQGYGIFMVLSGRQKIFLSGVQKKILLANIYACWIYLWAALNWKNEQYRVYNPGFPHFDFFGVSVAAVHVPYGFVSVTLALAAVTTLAAAAVFIGLFIRHGRFPFNAFTGYVMPAYLWLGAGVVAAPQAHVLMFIPMLHSLQYLPFVWKMTYERAREEGGMAETARKCALKKTLQFVAAGIIAGALMFQIVPGGLDHAVRGEDGLSGPRLFMLCFAVFINIHHYFIDFAIWRKDNPEMKYLFR